MQNKSFFITLGLTALTSLACLSINLSPSFSQSNSAAQPDKVTFFCRDVFDSASSKTIPATVAWIPERKGNVRMIGWKSEYFNKGGWKPEVRCQKVTENFQHLYSHNHLNYLTYGMVNGSTVICGLANQEETCNHDNQLFTIKLGSNPELVLKRLMDIAEGTGGTDMLLQSSGKQTYVAVQPFLNKASLLSKGN